MSQKYAFKLLTFKNLFVVSVSVLISLSAVSLANRFLGEGPPLIWFVPAVLFSAYVGGFGTGMIAVAVSALIAAYSLLPPKNSFAFSSPNDQFRMIVFLGIGTCISILIESLHRARRIATQTADEMSLMCNNLSREIEQHKKTQNQLQKRERELEHLLATIPAAVISVDLDQRYRFCNDTFAHWFGTSTELLAGLTVKEVVPAAYYEKILPNYLKAFAGQATSFDEYLEFRDRGRHVHVEMIPDFDAQGNVCGCTTLKYDISGHVALEASLEMARHEAEMANRAKSIFIANMSHEIRTPLSAILGFSELVRSPMTTESEREKWFEIISRNGALLNSIIGDILDFSKIEAQKLDINKVPIATSEVIKDVINVVSLKAKEKGIDVLIRNIGAIPEFIETDASRLKQVLLNIIGNAIKFSDVGPVEVTVQQVIESGKAKLAFYVKDRGCGITQEQAERLFAPFTQADAKVSRKYGGTGLGLVLSRKIAEKLGGSLDLVSSALGLGSTFAISVDIGDVAQIWARSDDTPKVQPTFSNDFFGSAPLRNLRFLIVEDCPDLQLLMAQILQTLGATSLSAADGFAAIKILNSEVFDYILMDIQMPRLNGYETLSRLRHSGYTKPIFALTAQVTNDDFNRAHAAGFEEILPKPFNCQLLVEAVVKHSQRVASTPYQLQSSKNPGNVKFPVGETSNYPN